MPKGEASDDPRSGVVVMNLETPHASDEDTAPSSYRAQSAARKAKGVKEGRRRRRTSLLDGWDAMWMTQNSHSRSL